jgi:plasmid stabilization system protein ParE
MATKQPLTVIYSPTAEEEIWGIWVSNLDRYGYDHAEDYVAFLRTNIHKLSTDYEDGKPVEGFPELKSLTIKRSRKGDGHIAIYEIDEAFQVVNIHHVYHTKMDVRGRLESDRP